MPARQYGLMHKYEKIFHLGHRLNQGILGAGMLYITEKIDGTNFRFRRKGDEIVYGSHATELGNFELVPSKRCQKCIRHKVAECHHTFFFIAKWIEENIDVEDLEPGFVYFGEGGLKHTLTYENLPPFVGIDIWVEAEKLPFKRRGVLPSAGRYMTWDVAAKMFEKIGIPAVLVIWRGRAVEWVGKQPNLAALISKSYYGEVIAEGIVLKNYDSVDSRGKQLFAKIKREEFQERAKATFGVKPKGTPLDLDVVLAFCNDVRINKGIDRLFEEGGQDLGMTMMRDLYKLVGDDILEEEIVEIARMAKGRRFDFKAFYNSVAKRCAVRLQERMVEDAR